MTWVVGMRLASSQWVLEWRAGDESHAWVSQYPHEINLMGEGPRYLTQSEDTWPGGSSILSDMVVLEFLFIYPPSLSSDPSCSQGEWVYGHPGAFWTGLPLNKYLWGAGYIDLWLSSFIFFPKWHSLPPLFQPLPVLAGPMSMSHFNLLAWQLSWFPG